MIELQQPSLDVKVENHEAMTIVDAAAFSPSVSSISTSTIVNFTKSNIKGASGIIITKEVSSSSSSVDCCVLVNKLSFAF